MRLAAGSVIVLGRLDSGVRAPGTMFATQLLEQENVSRLRDKRALMRRTKTSFCEPAP
jgi:hypothetical protein